jgi:CBS domain containing-hemolysin-like protein
MQPWLTVIITLLFSAFFSGMEIAFISANKLKVELDKSKGLLSARIMSDFNKTPSRFIGAMLLGNNIALVIYGMAIASILDPAIAHLLPPKLQGEFLNLIIQVILATLIILVVAEFLPKTLFRLNPNTIINYLAVPVYLFYYLFYPVIFFFIGLSEFILKKIFHVKLSKQTYDFTPVDLDHFLAEYFAYFNKDLELPQEIQMFRNVIDFRNIKLRECMVPRTEIEAIEDSDTLTRLKLKFIETGYSRILVYNNSIDNIIGYVYAFDLFKNPSEIKSITNPVIIVPETMLAKKALTTFIQQHKSIAVVVDEFGGTSGMVTIEDIIEEILGEIEDEYDSGDLLDKQINENEYVFSGRLELDYLNEKYNLNLPASEEYETLAGFILHHYGSIPQPKDQMTIGPYVFYIIQSTASRINKVRLIRRG